MMGLLLALLLSGAHANAVSDGAAAFDDGKLDGAIAVWQPVAEAGGASGVLHYDLGVAYYRKGDVPRAIAEWRIARRLRPRDADVVHNLAVARADLDHGSTPVEDPAVWLSVATPTEFALLAALLLGIGSGGLVLWRLRHRGPWTPFAGLSAAGAAVAALSLGGQALLEASPVAVVVDEAPLRQLASPEAEVMSHLSAGAEVFVEQIHGGLVLVEDGDGRRGWIPEGTLVMVDP